MSSIYRRVDRTCFYSSSAQQNSQLGPATLRAGNVLAVLCLLFGAAFTAFVPATPEERIGSLFFFGLVPAAGFYAGGHILSQLLVLGSELCEMIAARCFRCFARLVNSFVIWLNPPVSDRINRILNGAGALPFVEAFRAKSENISLNPSSVLPCPCGIHRVLMSADPECGEICYQSASFLRTSPV
jgi:hypothetical protein